MNSEFQTYQLNEKGKKSAIEIAKAFDELLNKLLKMNSRSREMELVSLKLEEACFFAKKAMAAEPSNCVDDS